MVDVSELIGRGEMGLGMKRDNSAKPADLLAFRRRSK
jgi:hypothetical protein